MATPQASDLLSDGEKSLRALQLGREVIKISKTLSTEIETIRSVASRAEMINECSVPEVQEFRNCMLTLCIECRTMETAGHELGVVEQEMNTQLKQIVKSKESKKKSRLLKDCLNELQRLLDTSTKFVVQYEKFRGFLDEAIKSCNVLLESVERSKACTEEEISNRKWSGYGTSAGLGAAAATSVALGIAGIFTFGTAWVAAAALTTGAAVGGALAATAVNVGISTALDVNSLNKKIDELAKLSQELKLLLTQLDQVHESSTGNIQLPKEVIDAISVTIAMYQERYSVYEQKEEQDKREMMLNEREAEIKKREANIRAPMDKPGRKKKCLLM